MGIRERNEGKGRRHSGVTALLVAGLSLLVTWPAVGEPAALSVGGLKVSTAELRGAAGLNLTLTGFHKTPDAAAFARAQEKISAELLDEMLLAALAGKRKVAPESKRIDARYEAAAKSYGGPRAFEKLLARAGSTRDFYRRRLGWQLQGEALLEAEAVKAGAIPEKRLRAHFEGDRERYQMPASFHVVAALVKLDPGRLTQAGYRDTLKATAGNLAEKLRAGESLESLSSDYPMAEIKDLGFAHSGALIPELAVAVEKLEVGKVAGPIQTFRGYLVARLLEKRPPQPLTFEQVRKAIQAELEQARKDTTRVALLKEARKRYAVKQPGGEAR